MLIYYIFKNLLICKTNYFILQSRIYYKDKKMAENKLADLSMEFSINTLKMLDNVKGHYALKNQLEKSSTSIGANITNDKNLPKLSHDCGTIRRMLIASVNTAKSNSK